MTNKEHAKEDDAREPHKLKTVAGELATEVQQTTVEDGQDDQFQDACNTASTEEESGNDDISPASSSSDGPTSTSNTRRASLPGAYRMRPSQRFTSDGAQVLQDDASNNEIDGDGRITDGPAVLTAQVEPTSRRSSPATSPGGSIEAEVMATVVQDSTVIEGTPIDPESVVSEITPSHGTFRKKQKQLICSTIGIFAILLGLAVGLPVYFTRRSNQPAEQVALAGADGEFTFMGCYKDKYPTNRDLPVMLESAEYDHTSCYRGCALQGFAYFGLQFWGECHCGNTYGQFGEVDCTDCSESAEFYGDNVNCVYEIVSAQ